MKKCVTSVLMFFEIKKHRVYVILFLNFFNSFLVVVVDPVDDAVNKVEVPTLVVEAPTLVVGAPTLVVEVPTLVVGASTLDVEAPLEDKQDSTLVVPDTPEISISKDVNNAVADIIQQDVKADSSENGTTDDNGQSSPNKPREARSQQRHSDFVLRALPNAVRGNGHVAWELDHRPLFIAPLRSESPRPRLSSDCTHPKKPAKQLHDLVLEQQHADRVREVAMRRDAAISLNERVEDVRRGNEIKLVTLKEKIAERNQRHEENRAEQERCRTANAQRDISRVQSARVGTRKKAKKLKECSTEKAKRAEKNLEAQKEAKAKKMAEVEKRRREVAAKVAQNEREVRCNFI